MHSRFSRVLASSVVSCARTQRLVPLPLPQELLGVAARGDFDLRAHALASGKALDYFDEATKARFVPHVVEPSVGVDRLFLALLASAYCEDEVRNIVGKVRISNLSGWV